MFWCQRCRCSDSWKQWTEKSHLSFCSTVLVYVTKMFGVFDPDRLKLQGHHPRLKCSMVLSGGKMLWKDMHNRECISNVFLWAPVCMSSLFAVLLNTTERKPFLCLLSMSNTGKMVAKWKEHIALPAEFSPKQNNFVIANNMDPKP